MIIEIDPAKKITKAELFSQIVKTIENKEKEIENLKVEAFNLLPVVHVEYIEEK